MHEGQIMVALRDRYKAPAHAFLPQVRNQTGFRRRVRTADAIAMSLYPSRGLDLHGFEVKVSRSDWIRERDDPEKAEEIARFCNFWWVVVGDPAIVPLDELPPTWGLLVPHGKSLRAAREAPRNEAVAEPTRAFLAAILRKAVEVVVPQPEVEALLTKKLEEAMAARDTSKDHELRRVKDELAALKASVTEFEAAAGITINRYYAGAMGRAVSLLRDLPKLENLEHQIGGVRATAHNVLNAVEDALKRVKEARAHRPVALDAPPPEVVPPVVMTVKTEADLLADYAGPGSGFNA